ncbi:GerMN domain-containing protein [Fusibacter ferrireducens]|uniref:GerMN domain-containing protein n=1 Tax=Fusibacter ferrireducens TaxID=2785058 RepID=A0ABR9ZY56_9FIRM|nr:GerMN domain-containing protein [Fusibacter ferrireducens]MBF4694891.1 GerMN domain-containing protein [Fusibacter ferrireducens]
MNFPVRSIIILILIVASLIFGLNVNSTYPDIMDSKYISPDKETIAFTTRIYFVYDHALRGEDRKVAIHENDFEKAVLKAIQDGPKNVKYKSIFDYDVHVLSVDYANNTCYLNLSNNVMHSDLWESDELDLYIWSIVNSLTEIKRVFNVQLLIDGERVDRKVLGYSFLNPLPKMESLNYVKERTASDSVIDFVDYINSSRLDLAYDLLTDNTKKIYDYMDFTKYSNTLNNEINGYTRDMYFTKTYNDRWVIYVKFLKNLNSSDVQVHFYKKWTVILIDGEYKIDLLRN